MTSGTRTDIEPSASLREVKSIKQAADQLNVSDRSVDTAKEIKRDAPDLAEKVSRGYVDTPVKGYHRKTL